MKKVILLLVLVIFLSGCSVYQTLHGDSAYESPKEQEMIFQQNLKFQCSEERLVYIDSTNIDLLHNYSLPKKYVKGVIRNQPEYFVPNTLFFDLFNTSTKPIVCETEREERITFFEWSNHECNAENKTFQPYLKYRDYPASITILCCFEEYCTEIDESLSIISVIDECTCKRY